MHTEEAVDEAVARNGGTGPLRLCLLNGFELESSSRAVALPLSAQRLLAFVALHERPILRSYASASLWLDKDEARAAANLRTALWRLRGPGFEVVAPSGAHLRLADHVTVDLRDAETQARRLLHPTDPHPLDVVDSSLLSADLLPDWYDDWVLVERERFRQLRLHALEALCTRLVGDGRRLDRAVDAGLAAVAAEPLRESAHRALIEAYLTEGNCGEALRQYECYRKLLWENLALEPSPRMAGLIDACRSPGMAARARP